MTMFNLGLVDSSVEMSRVLEDLVQIARRWPSHWSFSV